MAGQLADELLLLSHIHGDDWEQDATHPGNFSIRLISAQDGIASCELWFDCSDLLDGSNEPRFPSYCLRRVGPGLSRYGEQIPVADEVDNQLRLLYQVAQERNEGFLFTAIDWLKEHFAVALESDATLQALLSAQSASSSSSSSSSSFPSSSASASPASSSHPAVPRIFHGETIADRKSIFQGHAARVENVEQVKAVLAALRTDRKIERATHNMFAYRFIDKTKAAVIADNDDDGEDAAGGRLAHLLAIRSCQNVLVVVSRWYGGTPLGPVRFKHINTAARSALDLLPD